MGPSQVRFLTARQQGADKESSTRKPVRPSVTKSHQVCGMDTVKKRNKKVVAHEEDEDEEDAAGEEPLGTGKEDEGEEEREDEENSLSPGEATRRGEKGEESKGEEEVEDEENSLSQGEAAGRGEEGEEGRRSKGLPGPKRVTKEEREDHERTHTPFRAWCKYCVRGRGQNIPHLRSKQKYEEIKVPRVSMDYFFMSKQYEKAITNPLIVLVDEGTGEKYARATGQKGLGQEGEMDWLVKDIYPMS